MFCSFFRQEFGRRLSGEGQNKEKPATQKEAIYDDLKLAPRAWSTISLHSFATTTTPKQVSNYCTLYYSDQCHAGCLKIAGKEVHYIMDALNISRSNVAKKKAGKKKLTRSFQQSTIIKPVEEAIRL